MEYMAKKFDEGDHGGRPVSVGAKREGWRARLFSSGSDTNTDLDEVSKLTKKGFLQRISSIRKYVRSPKTRQKSESCASSTDDVSVVKESSGDRLSSPSPNRLSKAITRSMETVASAGAAFAAAGNQQFTKGLRAGFAERDSSSEPKLVRRNSRRTSLQMNSTRDGGLPNIAGFDGGDHAGDHASSRHSSWMSNDAYVKTCESAFNTSAASVVVIKSAGGGAHIGKVTGSNMPIVIKAPDMATLISTVVASLVSSGFTIAAMVNASEKDEVIFTLVRQPGIACVLAVTPPSTSGFANGSDARPDAADEPAGVHTNGKSPARVRVDPATTVTDTPNPRDSVPGDAHDEREQPMWSSNEAAPQVRDSQVRDSQYVPLFYDEPRPKHHKPKHHKGKIHRNLPVPGADGAASERAGSGRERRKHQRGSDDIGFITSTSAEPPAGQKPDAKSNSSAADFL